MSRLISEAFQVSLTFFSRFLTDDSLDVVVLGKTSRYNYYFHCCSQLTLRVQSPSDVMFV